MGVCVFRCADDRWRTFYFLEETMFCKNCGTKLDDNSKFCPACGTPTTPNPEQNVTSSPVITPTIIPVTPPDVEKKDDDLTKASLALAILASLFSLGMILNMIGSGIAPLVVVLGFFFLIPAFIVSIIAFVKSLITFKKDHQKSTAFKIRIVSFGLSVVLPCLILLLSVVISNPLRYSQATEHFEAGSYADAYEIFNALGDYKDSAEKAKESRYMSGIALAQSKDWEQSVVIFEELANEDYRASKELYLYCDAQNRMNDAMDSATTTLKSRLKDPSSFQNLGNSCRYSFSTKGSSLSIHINGTLKYSATNSFGGRVTETYSYEKDILLSGHNFTPQDAETILSKSITKIASDYDR